MRISEIFLSIQGESSYAGLPCVFVRTTGCDLRCSWCDTTYAFSGGSLMDVGEIISEVERYNCELVVLTGGEPLLQPDINELATTLADSGHNVLIETGGHRDISGLDPRVIRIMDLKCPSSGECHKNLFSNLEQIRPFDEIKFVIADRDDYDWALTTIRSNCLENKTRLLISPVHGAIESRQIVEWMLKDSLKARFQIQIHKYIWPPRTRGV